MQNNYEYEVIHEIDSNTNTTVIPHSAARKLLSVIEETDLGQFDIKQCRFERLDIGKEDVRDKFPYNETLNKTAYVPFKKRSLFLETGILVIT
jgi:hypothetical protein